MRSTGDIKCNWWWSTSAGAARLAWGAAVASLYPFINNEVRHNHAIEAARTTFVYNLVAIGCVIFLLALLLLGWLQFRLTLRPIANLARIAHSLADGKQATIKSTNRNHEIGQLISGLAAWQETIGGAMFVPWRLTSPRPTTRLPPDPPRR